jgi:hypothetical protein
MNKIVKASQEQSGEWVVRLLSTGEEIARFDSRDLACKCVNRINASASASPDYNRNGGR